MTNFKKLKEEFNKLKKEERLQKETFDNDKKSKEKEMLDDEIKFLETANFRDWASEKVYLRELNIIQQRLSNLKEKRKEIK